MTAATSEEADLWSKALQKASLDNRAKYGTAEGEGDEDEGGEDLGFEEEVNLLPGTGIWLTKKGEGVASRERKRYFVLLKGKNSKLLKLAYFVDVKNGVPIDRKGFVPLTVMSNISTKGALIMIVS